MSNTLVFYVNGSKVTEENPDPEWTLLFYLRSKLSLCGVKNACGEGGCGACTVLVSKWNKDEKKITHFSANACLFPVCAAHGLAVTTVEGLGNTRTQLHPVQERLAKAHGVQCGFCTPGIVMSMYALLRSCSGKPTMEEIEKALQGNLCRCTGYRPILEGYRTFTEEWEAQKSISKAEFNCGMGDNCCRYKTTKSSNDTQRISSELFCSNNFKPHDPSQEIIFPPELQVSSVFDSQSLVFKGQRVVWYRPTSFDELLELKYKFPHSKIVCGNTEIGIESKFKNDLSPILIHPSHIKELFAVSNYNDGLKIGAGLTISGIEEILKRECENLPEHKGRIFKAMLEAFKWFGATQVRNVGTIGGNIMTGSPISDIVPILMAAKCKLEIWRKGSSSYVQIDEKFFTGYRQNIIPKDAILTSIYLPHSEKNQYFAFYKQARRRDDDTSIVNAAFNVSLQGNKIKSIHLAYGGMSNKTQMAERTSSALLDREWDLETLNEAYSKLIEDFPLQFNSIGGLVTFRRSLTLSFFFKFFIAVKEALEGLGFEKCNSRDRSAQEHLQNLTPRSSQYFSLVPLTQEKHDAVGRPVVHQSAFKSTSGEALFCDDLPRFDGELYMSFVVSTRAHAKILSIDYSQAMEIPGVIDFFSASVNRPYVNNFGPVEQDEEIFAQTKVKSHGQIIAAVVATDQLVAERAKKLVKVEYEDINPLIISIEDAIRENSFMFDKPMVMTFGNTEEAFKTSEYIIEDEIRIGSQEHFYMEPHCCVAVPKKEDNEIEIFASTQQPTSIQASVAQALGIPRNRVVCRVKRIGGGFGGKETRAALVSLPVAVAAHKLQRPVRTALPRDEDMMLSGKRHAVYAKYKVGFDSSGKIVACELTAYANGGCTVDISEPLIERVLIHFQNAYHIPNVTATGYVCKTNTQSNTAFRGTGAPQGMLIGETIVRHVAETLGMDPTRVAELNLYREDDVTHYHQKLTNCTLLQCWEQCKIDSNYLIRKEKVEEYNRENRWRKRGISMVPTMFGIAFGVVFLNQAGALVLIYTDGSVLISHGGVEIGQGLHTKMIQVASRALGIPSSLIHISETSTDKVPNTSPTAASSSSDLNGMAVLNACMVLNERLKPIKDANPNGKWEDWVSAAYLARISLAASAFYKTPDIGFDPETKTGNTFNYFTYGAACSEVEIDCLTGDHKVLRTDIVMDIGESLNPAVDIGQIEGAFMQGYGFYTLEEILISPSGELLSRGPGSYKIPAFSDIPSEFNVSLLKGSSNPRAVYSSKAVGEPPLFLSSSIFFALREAVKSERADSGFRGWFNFNSPATSARIRMSCEDPITEKFLDISTDHESSPPWNVQLS